MQLGENMNRAFRETGTPNPPRRSTPPKRSKEELERFERSRTAYRGRTTAAAVRKQIGTRSPALVSTGAVVPKASEIDEVIGQNAIRVRGKDGRAEGVMLSSLPLAQNTGDDPNDPKWKVADLAFDENAGRFQVKRPLVPVSAPKTAGGSLLIGNLAVRLAPKGSGAEGVASGENVVYPDESRDRDLLVRALPIGASIAASLRSPLADRSISMPLDLQKGEKLVKDAGGSAKIVDDQDRTVGAVSIATARDADGQSVPMTTKVDEAASTITYTVDPDPDETAWPINLDPDLFYDVNWRTGSTNYDGWFNLSTPRGNAAQPFQYFQSAENLPTSQGGLGIFTPASTNYQQIQPGVFGEAGAWGRFAPGDPDAPGTIEAGTGRKLSSEHAIWYRFDAGSLVFGYVPTVWYHASNYLRPRIGFLDRDGNADTSSHWQEQTGTNTWGAENPGYVNDLGNGTNGASGRIYLTNPDNPDSGSIASKTDNIIGVGLVDQVGDAGGWWPDRPSTSLAMGWYRAYAVDAVDPTLTVTGLPTGWVDALPSVKVSSVDHGVGVQRIGLRDDFGNVLSQVNEDCPLTANKVCTWNVDNQDLPIPDLGEGIRTGNIVALDAGGRYKAQNVQIQLDSSAPDLTLAGDLFTQRDTEIGPTEPRALTINTADGNPSGAPAEQRSGVQRVEVYVDDDLVHSVDQTVAGDSQPLNTSWTPPAGTFTAGDYVVRVVTTDRLGHEKDAQFTVHAPCCGQPLTDQDIDAGARAYRFGDFNGDGAADVVLVDTSSGAATVRLGTGDGTFGPAAGWGTLGDAVQRTAVGDYNGDGRADLVGQTSSGTLLRVDSNGTAFVAPPDVTASSTESNWPASRSLQMADIDGDGFTDLWGVDASTRVLWVAEGTDLGFLPARDLLTIPGTRDVDVADLDGDGAGDLLTYEPSDGVVRFRPALEDEIGFDASQTWGTGPQDAQLTFGDVNRDRLEDIVFRVAQSGEPDRVFARASSIEGGFAPGDIELGTIAQPFAITSHDLDADGRSDVVGTRLNGTTLEVRSTASRAPGLEQDLPFPDDLPEDEDDTDSAPSARATAAAANDGVTLTPAEISAQDDRNLLWKRDIGATPVSDVLDQLKHLGVTKLRIFVWWGQVDRLHPDAMTTPVVEGDPPTQTPTDRITLSTYPDGTTPKPYPTVPAGIAFDDTQLNPAGAPSGAAAKRVEQRWLWGPYDDLIKLAHQRDMTVHVTLSGATWSSYTECDSAALQTLGTYAPRGCVGSGAGGGQFAQSAEHYRPTGWNPRPQDYRHFVQEAVSHFKTLPDGAGAAVTSVGLWNEPNATLKGKPSRYLAITDEEPGGALRIHPSLSNSSPSFMRTSDETVAVDGLGRNSAERYGELYAAGYAGAKAASPQIKVAFGEVTPKTNSFNGGSGKTTPHNWVRQALNRAKARWTAEGNPGAVPITDAFAVHPYQPKKAPWEASPDDPYGVNGVTGKVRTNGNMSLRRRLDRYAKDLKILSSRSTAAGTAGSRPPIWATEFGYYNYNPNSAKGVGTDSHAEIERVRWIRDAPSAGSKKRGTLQSLITDGKVRMVNFWNVIERPPAMRGAPPLASRGSDQDTGFLGSVPRTMSPGVENAEWAYPGPVLAVRGSRGYGRQAGSLSLNHPQSRLLGCEIRKWITDKAHRNAKAYTAAATPMAGQRACPKLGG
ncbi:VCBS repeat-containing protein [Patulibacter sp. NPDC049589]|uniref:FG-GAP repeat domain-containing protein n=1 Tax=Patulibacter sp. NPDC049589 TaxID=3154731 RepID=UPI00341E0A2D